MKVLVFGATGHLGKAIAGELKQQAYDFTVVVRSQARVAELLPFTRQYIVANVTEKNTLVNICQGFEVVISALGKSVSPNDKSKPTFQDIDFTANSNILSEALKAGVGKFVYVSALHSENYLHLEYFRVHHAFSEKLKASGINYSIIKPPAIFSAFIDMIGMAEKGRLVTIGKGDKKTNPIYEGDLAKVCVDAIKETNSTIEAGGNEIYTRSELNEIIQQQAAPSKRVRWVPLALIKAGLPLLKLLDKNAYDKFAFFTAVTQDDTLAPPRGTLKFAEYIKRKATAMKSPAS